MLDIEKFLSTWINNIIYLLYYMIYTPISMYILTTKIHNTEKHSEYSIF